MNSRDRKVAKNAWISKQIIKTKTMKQLREINAMRRFREILETKRKETKE